MSQTLPIAEGDAELCDIFQSFLTTRGYGVETASNGLDCVEKLRRVVPAAIVLDRELCWRGGDGVLAWLRESEATLSVPVVLTATAGYLPDGTNAIEPPVVAVLAKPFTLTALLESVRAAVAKKECQAPFNGIGAPAGPELCIG
jgi:DNA-binding response OmpR family regulator